MANHKTLGTIETFDPATQMATVKLACNDIISTSNNNFRAVEGWVLIDVPVEFPRSATHCITLPVAAGDDCIVEFFDKGISHWLYEDRRKYDVKDGCPEPAALRKFNRNDAVCRVSIGNLAKPISGFNSTALQIRSLDGAQHITLDAEGGISIVAATVSVQASGAMTLQGDSVAISGNSVTINGDDVSLDGGNVNVAGDSTTVRSGGTLTLAGSGISMTR